MANEFTATTNTVAVGNTAKLTKLLLTSISSGNTANLLVNFVSLTVQASIHEPCNYGEIVIQDPANLIDTTPIIGQEYIEIEFQAPGGNGKDNSSTYEPYHRLFFVYSVSSVSETVDGRFYTLRFTDIMGIINNDTRFSIMYNLKTEDILQNIKAAIEDEQSNNKVFKEIVNRFNDKDSNTGRALYQNNELFAFYKGTDYSVNTKYNIEVVVPYWKPLTLIQYLVDHSVSDEQTDVSTQFADCVFYQNRVGKYILSSYSKMFNTEYRTKFAVSKSGHGLEFVRTLVDDAAGSNVITQKYKVKDFSMVNLFDSQQNKYDGLNGCSIYVTDFAAGNDYITEISAKQIDDKLVDYLKINKLKNFAFVQKTAFKKTTNPLIATDVSNINASANANGGYNDGLLRYKSFTLPYIKGNIFKKYIELNKVILTLEGVTDIDIGVPVKITMKNPPKNGQASNANDTGLSDRSVAEFCSEYTWVISKYAYNVMSNGTIMTIVEAFTPYLNYPDSKRMKDDIVAYNEANVKMQTSSEKYNVSNTPFKS